MFCCGAPTGRAATYGDAPWCAVVNGGADNITWMCEYASVDDCLPLVLGGNRGFCQPNPYWRNEPAPVAPRSSLAPPPPRDGLGR